MSQILTNFRFGASKSGPYVEVLLSNEVHKLTVVPSRTKYWHNRHRDPKYRTERARKVWKIDLPDFDKDRATSTELSPDEIRSKMKEKGIAPPSLWNERELYSPSTLSVMEPFKPSDDEKSTSLMDKLKSPFLSGKSFVQDKREVSRIRAFEGEDFSLEDFAKEALDTYIKAHEALAAKDESRLFELITEYCFPLMTAGLKRHTIIWNYLGEVEPPKVVQTRTGDMITKGNKFSQITVKMHTKQMLEIYDRHGRLIHGSPRDVKEVLEYVVFEKYLADEYGKWRIHDRIRPNEEESQPAQQMSKTYVKRPQDQKSKSNRESESDQESKIQIKN